MEVGSTSNEENEEDDGASVQATAQIIYGIGWVPHETQLKPKMRGSAKHKVSEIVVEETKHET